MSIDAKGTIERTGDIWNPEYLPSWASSQAWVSLFTPVEGESGNVHIVTKTDSGPTYTYAAYAYVKTSGVVVIQGTLGIGTGSYGELQNSSGAIQVRPNASFTGSMRIRTEKF